MTINEKPWVMAQTWCDLLFAHWPVPAAVLRRVVPPELELDLWEGEGWLGVVPFRMEGIRPRRSHSSRSATIRSPWREGQLRRS